eukprot:gene9650-9461_t
MTSTAFNSLPLAPALLANLDTLGYKEMTAIQAQSLPSVLEGRDLIAQAKTGSGKTAAFGIGILAKLNPAWFAVQALVLCPTRELADQVANELRRLARATGNVKVLVLTVTVEAQHDNSQIEQLFFEIGFDQRNSAVARLLAHYKPVSAIAFCNTKVQCRELVDELRAKGFSALALYGELEQRERDEILVLFANRSCSVLVATDVAARGLDIQNLEAVINVDVSKDTEVHIHRIGRTGRGGEQGLALSLCAPNEKKWVKLIEEYQQAPVAWYDLDSLDEGEYGVDAAPMMTLVIAGGKKDKLRPGDVLGALTGDAGLAKEQVGKINVTEFQTYVAIDRRVAYEAFDRLAKGSREGADFGSFKGRNFKMRFIEI